MILVIHTKEGSCSSFPTPNALRRFLYLRTYSEIDQKFSLLTFCVEERLVNSDTTHEVLYAGEARI